MKRQGTFPFTAIIGQDTMKRALVLNVVNPKLGGVLIQGEKGTAKSTISRFARSFKFVKTSSPASVRPT